MSWWLVKGDHGAVRIPSQKDIKNTSHTRSVKGCQTQTSFWTDRGTKFEFLRQKSRVSGFLRGILKLERKKSHHILRPTHQCFFYLGLPTDSTYTTPLIIINWAACQFSRPYPLVCVCLFVCVLYTKGLEYIRPWINPRINLFWRNKTVLKELGGLRF